MQGYNVLILPGTDHAGIGTQNVVERELAREGLTRHDLGRAQFADRVWKWKEKYGNAIEQQFRTLGFAFDWSRSRFTMDPGYVDAVMETFVRLFQKGYIYRGERIINWCIRCHSAISDLEVEHVETAGHLYYFKYPYLAGDGGVVIATTRPETMLGDTAVAVHPADARYQSLIGRTLVLPIVGREIPVVGDDFVDPEFGTGAVKITPAHDPYDFEAGERHGLPAVRVIGTDGLMTQEAGRFCGMDRYEAREAVMDELTRGGYVVRTDPYMHRVGTCERCGTTIEPMISKQWFVRMAELAKPAVSVVRSGEVRFIPERWGKVYLDWMENIRDWTISRQIWWGHRIPIWYCLDCGEVVASKSSLSSCPACSSSRVEQDPDVLDTWFSSALWPFATLGWPRETEDLRYFYPTSLMVTSSQIIFLWVARMIMTGLEFRGDIPFPEVFINPTVLNSEGRRMSKSLGTGVDPLETTARYGADATRLGLIIQAGQTQEVRYSDEKVEQARNFANKIWNMGRLVVSMQEGTNDPSDPEPALLSLPDRWILSRLASVRDVVTNALESYNLNEAAQALYDFLWSELADWYLEAAKIAAYGQDSSSRLSARRVSRLVLDNALKLLHPFMPFVTEEIWQHLAHQGDSLMLAPWPEARPRDPVAEAEFGVVMEVIRSIRTARSESRVEAGRWIEAVIEAGGNSHMLRDQSAIIARLARVDVTKLSVFGTLERPPARAVTLVMDGVVVYLPMAGMVDVEAERKRLVDEIASGRTEVSRIRDLLGKEEFTNKAPARVVLANREKLEATKQRIQALEERLETL
jgi:valyl-tRNA synthetase